MSFDRGYGLYAVQFDSTLIGGIDQCSMPNPTEVSSEARSGEPYARQQYIVGQSPSVAFRSIAVAAMLNQVGSLGALIAAASANINVINVFQQQMDQGGTRAGASSHRKAAIVDGMVVPTTLDIAHQADATIGCEVLATHDGTNNPIALTENVTLPSGIVDDEAFTLGKTTLGGILLAGVRSIGVNFGLVAVREGADSDIWPTFAYIKEIKPTITFRGIDLQWWKDSGGFPLLGGVGTHANTIIYLRKRSGSGFVADGTAEHIKITADGYVTVDQLMDASGNELGEVSLTMTCKYDGTNNPIVINTASAIT